MCVYINISLNKEVSATLTLLDVSGKVVKTQALNGISTSINTALKNSEPRIEVLNTNIQANADSNEVRITVTGRVKSTNEIIDISTTIERLR